MEIVKRQNFMKKILFIAPIPPPIDGQSKASKVVLESLQSKYEIQVVNLSKSTQNNSSNSWKRIFDIYKILQEVKKNRKNNDFIFLSLAESFAGNMRDIFIYYLCRKKLNKLYIQMLGGAGMKEILSGNGWQQKTNKKYLEKVAGVIVEGNLNFDVFKKIVPQNKIHIVPNFAEDSLFLSPQEIAQKFESLDQVKILYLSNLLPGKGYDELADAYISLSAEEQNSTQINFVGGFESEKSEKDFIKKIKEFSGMNYLGKFIDGDAKKELFKNSHVFCLPTYYPFEGQPISILEAYATGCAVITTDHSGIPYIFKDKKNGYIVEKESVSSLVMTLKKVLNQKQNLKEFALFNNQEARNKYRTAIYKQKILEIFQEDAEN